MMQPPAKRLRILQSVEVDEENEDYINAKRAQEKRLKTRMESIFAKYENMHESNSDIIDMRENKVVVDRGHLRRLERQVTRKETSILDTLGYSASKEEEEPSAEEEMNNREESEDELAPTQPPKAAKAEAENRTATILTTQNPIVAKVQPSPQHTAYTPGQAANLLQYVQFPQTPAGQQAQSTFYTTLTQTINQAVQQAVAPLFSGVLSNTPNLQLSAVQAPPPINATPSLHADIVAPATDPKWSFPPLPVKSPSPRTSQSTPFPIPVNGKTSQISTREVNETTFPTIRTKRSELQQLEDGPSIAHQHELHTIAAPCMTPSRRSPRVEIQRRRGLVSRYQFTKDDEIYISKKKVLDKCSWADIRNSRREWRAWPLKAFHNRWTKLKQRNLHLQVASREIVPDNYHESLSLSHNLPTPSSSRHEDHVDEPIEMCAPQGSDLISSSISHYDNEELELLSLAGDGHSDMPVVSDDDELQQEVVLPSIETPLELSEEDTIQQDLLQKSPTIEPPSTVENERVPTPKKAKARRPSLNPQQSIPYSEADPRDGFEYVNVANFTHPQPKNTPKLHQVRRSTSIDLVGDDDELLAPVTPRIQRESSTPLPMSFLYSSPAPNTRTVAPLSTSASNSKISQKTFRKQIKQSWTKMGTPGPKSGGKPLAKRKSLPMLNRNRAWDGGESEDELAM